MNAFKFYALLIMGAFVIMSGCSNEKKLLKQQVVAQADSISQLRVDLRSASDSLQNASMQLQQSRSEIDSISKENATHIQRARQLSSQVNKLKDDNKNLQDSLQISKSASDSIKTYYSGVLVDTINALAGFRSESAQAHQAVAQRDALLAQIKPWYTKWKHDSKRGFLKVLFGSGKAKNPDFPEPNF